MIENPTAAATAPYVSWKDAFTPAEVDSIVAIGDGLVLGAAAIGGARARSDDIRITRTATFPRLAQTENIYAKIEMLARAVNERVYQFDLTGFSEHFQYTVYEGTEGGHYDWHVDQGLLNVTRKLSFSVQLSAPEDYDGCDLELRAGNEIVPAPRARGTLIAFPAYVLHRVTPVTRGVRKSLVIWTAGPKFR